MIGADRCMFSSSNTLKPEQNMIKNDRTIKNDFSGIYLIKNYFSEPIIEWQLTSTQTNRNDTSHCRKYWFRKDYLCQGIKK